MYWQFFGNIHQLNRRPLQNLITCGGTTKTTKDVYLCLCHSHITTQSHAWNLPQTVTYPQTHLHLVLHSNQVNRHCLEPQRAVSTLQKTRLPFKTALHRSHPLCGHCGEAGCKSCSVSCCSRSFGTIISLQKVKSWHLKAPNTEVQKALPNSWGLFSALKSDKHRALENTVPSNRVPTHVLMSWRGIPLI